jgi:hypothetical protein
MGIIDDFKRLFWVKKAVAKSAADKAVEEGKEFASDLSDEVSGAWDKTKKTAEDIGEKIVDKTKETTSDLWGKKEDWTPKDSASPPPPKSEDSETFKTGEKIGEKVAETWDKAKGEGKELLDKAVKVSDKAWEKTEEVSEDLWNKAKDVASNVNKKFQEGVDSMLEKAKELDKKIEEEKDKIDPNRDGWADKSVREKLKEHESDLKDKDDFFEKAKKFGEGDYSMGKPIVTGKDATKKEDTSGENLTELPPLPDDDFADDAILDEDDK